MLTKFRHTKHKKSWMRGFMTWENINIKTVISRLGDAEKLNADGSYNTGYKLTDEVVGAMIYAKNNLLADKKNIYVQPCADSTDELKLYTDNIKQALNDGKTVLLPTTNGKHFVLTAIMPKIENSKLAADVVYINSTKDEANPHLTKVGKEVAKAVQDIVSQSGIECGNYKDYSREIQYEECCGLAVVQNALNVIQSNNIGELKERSNDLEEKITKQGKKAFYQEIGFREHSLLIQAPEVQAAITSPEVQQNLDRQLAFALQREEIDKLMHNHLSKAVKAEDKTTITNLLVQVGIALGEYGYADIDKQAQAMDNFKNKLNNADMASTVGNIIKSFGIDNHAIPDDFKQERNNISNKWQTKIRQEQQSAGRSVG